MNKLFDYQKEAYNNKRELHMELEKLSFEIRLYEKTKKDEFSKRYPKITYIDLLKKTRNSVKRKFQKKEDKILKNLLSTQLFH